MQLRETSGKGKMYEFVNIFYVIHLQDSMQFTLQFKCFSLRLLHLIRLKVFYFIVSNSFSCI
jgi:hypothetical protein